MVTTCKTWLIESPSRGGDVGGRATDQVGRPVSGALVRLGPYSAITDKAGEYRFTRVPADQPLVGIDFTVEKKDMPIIMRAIAR